MLIVHTNAESTINASKRLNDTERLEIEIYWKPTYQHQRISIIVDTKALSKRIFFVTEIYIWYEFKPEEAAPVEHL